MSGVWYGLELEARAQAASATAAIELADSIVEDTKRLVHVISGDLRRSIHSAPVGYMDAEIDESSASHGDIDNVSNPGEIQHAGGPQLEVGSWLPYACVEWVGRGHPGITQGLEMNRLKATALMIEAFRGEGL